MIMQKTLVVLKPDAVQRSIWGEIISRFERVWLSIVAIKMVYPTKDFYFHHYETIGQMITRRGQKAFDITLEMMLTGPVIAIILEGNDSIEVVRKMVGTTEPKSALPGTIRGDYAHMSFAYADGVNKGIPNLLHASGNIEEAEKEIQHWFAATEIFETKNVNHSFTR